MSYDLMMQLKIPGYRPVAASKGIIKHGKSLNRRGCVILVEDSVNVQPPKERTHSKVEMIGVKIIGDNNKKYEVPYELWCVYSGPYVTEDRACKQLLKKWENFKKDPGSGRLQQ